MYFTRKITVPADGADYYVNLSFNIPVWQGKLWMGPAGMVVGSDSLNYEVEVLLQSQVLMATSAHTTATLDSQDISYIPADNNVSGNVDTVMPVGLRVRVKNSDTKAFVFYVAVVAKELVEP